MKRFLTSIFCLVVAFSLSAQKRGVTIEKRNIYIQEHPEYSSEMIKTQQEVAQFWQQKNSQKTNDSDPVITIPVVIHLLYNTTEENLSDEQLLSQIEVLNEDFRRQNADTSNTPEEYKTVAADVQVEFCLAVRDPEGNPTTGIERKKTSKTSFNYIADDVKDDATGGLDAWNSNQYLNIWVCNLSGDILGYAQFPGMEPSTDGVVIHYKYFGRNGSAKSPFQLGRTCTHEVGHWLGLEHPWGDGGCNVDDDIADTPLCKYDYESSESEGCPSPGDECGEGRRMIENYMDYSQDACFNIFTQGQANRVVGIINTQRKSLLVSPGCRLYDDVPFVDFAANIQTVYQGGEVHFEAFVEDEDSLYWLFEGADTSTSSIENPIITYVEKGRHSVTLVGTNALGDSVLRKEDFIQVLETTENTTMTSFYLGGENVLEKSGEGYVSGHNDFGDLAKANYFGSPKPYVAIEGLKLLFGHVEFDNPDAEIVVAIWDVNAENTPGEMLASKTLKLSDIVVDDTLKVVFDDAPVEMLHPYFAGIQLHYEKGEVSENSVALYMTREGVVAPGIAWEQLSNGDWLPFTEATFSWGKNVALSIFPMLKMLPPEITFEATSTNFYVDEQILIKNSTKYAYDYTWDVGMGSIVDYEENNSPRVQYEEEGVYTITLLASNFLYEDEKTELDYLTVKDWPLSVQEFDELNIEVYPNPFRDKVQVKSSGVIKQVNGYDLVGRKLFSKKIDAQNGLLDLGFMSETVFLLEIVGIKGKICILMYKH